MSLNEGACPFATPQPAELHERSRLVQTAAQDMLNEPDESLAIAVDLEEDLQEQYGLMPDPKRSFLVAKGVRAAALAAMDHVEQGEMNRRILPVLESGGSLALASRQTAEQFVRWPLAAGSSGDAFTRAIYAWNMGVSEHVSGEITEAPEHPYRQLRETLLAANGQHADMNRRYYDEALPFRSSEFVAAARTDNSFAALRLMLHAGLSAEREEGITDAEGLAVYAARHIGLLAMRASVNRAVNARMSPLDIGAVFDRHEAHHDQAEVLSRYAGNFTGQGWNHRSLRNGSWSRPNCPGLTPLLSPDTAEREDADKLFEMVESRYQSMLPRSENGAYDRVVALIAFLGLNIAEHTIYKDWQDIRPFANRA